MKAALFAATAGAANFAARIANQRTSFGPPNAPALLRAVSASGTSSLSAYYDTPTNDGGYSITQYQVSIDGGSTYNITASPGTSPIVINNLSSAIDYNIRMRAVNSRGTGPASNIIPGTLYPYVSAIQINPIGSGSGGFTYSELATNGTNQFVVINTNNSNARVAAYSSDGINWITGLVVAARDSTSTISKVAYARPSGISSRYLAVGQNSDLGAYSTNGTNWLNTFTLNFDLTFINFISFAAANNIAIGGLLGGGIGRSSAITSGYNVWGFSGTTTYLDFAFGNGTWVSVGGTANTGRRSIDNALNWTNMNLSTTNNYTRVSFANDRFFAIGSATGSAVYSFDGITWTSANISGIQPTTRVRYGKGVYAAISTTGGIRYSVDGITWNTYTDNNVIQAGSMGGWTSLEYLDNVGFVAVNGNYALLFNFS